MAKRFRSNKYWWVERRVQMVFLLFLAVFFLIAPKKESAEGTVLSFPVLTRTTNGTLPLPSPAPYPIRSSTAAPPNLTAEAISIVDGDSGVVMYAKNDTASLLPASITKLMTALVALDTYKLTDVITIDDSTVSGQMMNLKVGEKMTVENLLYGMLIESGNDAATALAVHHPQGYDAFITAMNEKAKALNLDHSHFTNPVGYDDTDHKMTAQDISRLARAAMEQPLIAHIVSIPQITIPSADYTTYHSLKNVNELLGKVPGVAGIKTGWTEDAGENLATMVERNGRRVIIVVLKSGDRFGETTELINWVFANFQWINYGL